MSGYGLKTEEYLKKDAGTIKREIEESISAALGVTIPTSEVSLFGRLNANYADQFAEVWDLLEQLYLVMDPDDAAGDALESTAALTGTKRQPASKSTGTLDRIYLEDGRTLPVGKVVSVGAEGSRFVTLGEISNDLDYPDIFSVDCEAQEAGANEGLAGTIDTIRTPISGWRALAVSKSGKVDSWTFTGQDTKTLLIIVDGGIEQTYTITETDWPVAPVDMTLDLLAADIQSQVAGSLCWGPKSATGPLFIASATEGKGGEIQITGGTFNAVALFPTTNIAGMNSEDLVIGDALDTDALLQERREEDLGIQGTANIAAIGTRLLDVPGVTHVLILDNDSEIDDAVRTVRKKSIDPIVHGGADADVAQAIFDARSTVQHTDGKDVAEVITDSMDMDYTINISRPVEVPLYIDYTVVKEEGAVDEVVEAAVQAFVKDFTDKLHIDEDVIASVYHVLPLRVVGVKAVTAFAIDTTPPPAVTNNITIDLRELATVLVVDIDVTVV